MLKKNVIRVYVFPLFKDNYSYMVTHKHTNKAVLVDPADPPRIMEFLSMFKQLDLSHVLYTHKHWDHAGRSIELAELLKKRYPEWSVDFVAGEEDAKEIDKVDIVLKDDKGVFKTDDFSIDYYHAPCHTKGHILYNITPKQDVIESEDNQIINKSNYPFFFDCQSQSALFTGDTLFTGGCGRFFEGDAEQMLRNMDIINSLDKETEIYNGHEYTKNNLIWALKVDKDNQSIKTLLDKTNSMDKPMTLPSTVLQEQQVNLFMRCRDPTLQQLLNEPDPIKLMNKLRQLKNQGKGI